MCMCSDLIIQIIHHFLLVVHVIFSSIHSFKVPQHTTEIWINLIINIVYSHLSYYWWLRLIFQRWDVRLIPQPMLPRHIQSSNHPLRSQNSPLQLWNCPKHTGLCAKGRRYWLVWYRGGSIEVPSAFDSSTVCLERLWVFKGESRANWPLDGTSRCQRELSWSVRREGRVLAGQGWLHIRRHHQVSRIDFYPAWWSFSDGSTLPPSLSWTLHCCSYGRGWFVGCTLLLWYHFWLRCGCWWRRGRWGRWWLSWWCLVYSWCKLPCVRFNWGLVMQPAVLCVLPASTWRCR